MNAIPQRMPANSSFLEQLPNKEKLGTGTVGLRCVMLSWCPQLRLSVSYDWAQWLLLVPVEEVKETK